ncbi:hypothetical protein AKJ16_DCAP20286 [Drosera capensis]
MDEKRLHPFVQLVHANGVEIQRRENAIISIRTAWFPPRREGGPDFRTILLGLRWSKIRSLEREIEEINQRQRTLVLELVLLGAPHPRPISRIYRWIRCIQLSIPVLGFFQAALPPGVNFLLIPLSLYLSFALVCSRVVVACFLPAFFAMVLICLFSCSFLVSELLNPHDFLRLPLPVFYLDDQLDACHSSQESQLVGVYGYGGFLCSPPPPPLMISVNTHLLYQQTNFNLLREEDECYPYLVTLLWTLKLLLQSHQIRIYVDLL